MSTYYPCKSLRWARQRLRCDIDTFSKLLNMDATILKEWEEGNRAITEDDAKLLAYRLQSRDYTHFITSIENKKLVSLLPNKDKK